jgi:hypothetical protein
MKRLALWSSWCLEHTALRRRPPRADHLERRRGVFSRVSWDGIIGSCIFHSIVHIYGFCRTFSIVTYVFIACGLGDKSFHQKRMSTRGTSKSSPDTAV